MAGQPPRTLIDYTAAARMLGVPKSTLYAMVHFRQVPHLRLGKRLVRFDPDELQAWLDARRVPAVAERPGEGRGTW